MTQTQQTLFGGASEPSAKPRKGQIEFASASAAKHALKHARVTSISYAAPGSIPHKQWSNPNAAKDIQTFMRMYGHVGAVDAGRRCSEKTFTNRKVVLTATFNAIKAKIRGVSTLAQFTPRYIPVILEIWGERDAAGNSRLSYETQVQNFSVLTWFWRLHGMAVKPIKAYIEDPQERLKFARSSVATTDKSWSGNGIDVDEIMAKAKEVDPVVARLLLLGLQFGMRLNETLRVQPHEDDEGDQLHLTRGTKTGRARAVRYATFGHEALKEAICSVKAELSPGQHAAWEGRSLEQARHHMYYVLRKLGITKRDLGVTFHGLRSQFAIEQFQALTGATAPVRGGTAVDYNRFVHERRTVSEALGHNRIRVTSAYLGSFFAMKAPAERRWRISWEKLEAKLPVIKMVLDSLGVKNLWWVGARANGADNKHGERWEFITDDLVPVEASRTLAREIEGMVGDQLGMVFVHSSLEAPAAARKAWLDNALPLFEVEAPTMSA